MKTSVKNNDNHWLFNDVQFETSAAHFSQFPTIDLPEIAIVGRSNAGKSSVLNCIFNRKKLAFTAKEPGKTRLLNFFSVRCNGKATARMVDLPGYGYARVDKSLKKNWERTLLDFMLTRKSLIASLMITDCRRPLTGTDELMLNILLEKKIPYHVILNKSDKLNNSEKIATLEKCKKSLEKIDTKFKINGSCSLFSASKKTGLKELQFILMEWLTR